MNNAIQMARDAHIAFGDGTRFPNEDIADLATNLFGTPENTKIASTFLNTVATQFGVQSSGFDRIKIFCDQTRITKNDKVGKFFYDPGELNLFLSGY